VIDVGRVEIAAAIVKIYNLFKSSEVPIVKVGAAKSNIAQTGRAELADVVGIAGDLEASGVFKLWANADVVKLIVGEKSSSMTDIASGLIKSSLSAGLGCPQWIDLRCALIERRAI